MKDIREITFFYYSTNVMTRHTKGNGRAPEYLFGRLLGNKQYEDNLNPYTFL